MAMIKATVGNVEFIKWKDVEAGDKLCGFFMNSEESTRYKNNYTHYVESEKEDGTTVRYGLAGSGVLDKAMEKIKEGSYVEITYLGTDSVTKGPNAGSEYHKFDVAYDPARIHAQFTGDTTAHQKVEYKQPAGQEPAPTQQQPSPVQPPQPTPTASPLLPPTTQVPPPVQQTAPPPAEKKKRAFG